MIWFGLQKVSSWHGRVWQCHYRTKNEDMNTFENHKGSCIEPTKVSIRGLFADAVLGFKSHNLRWLISLHREDYLGKGRPGPMATIYVIMTRWYSVFWMYASFYSHEDGSTCIWNTLYFLVWHTWNRFILINFNRENSDFMSRWGAQRTPDLKKKKSRYIFYNLSFKNLSPFSTILYWFYYNNICISCCKIALGSKFFQPTLKYTYISLYFIKNRDIWFKIIIKN